MKILKLKGSVYDRITSILKSAFPIYVTYQSVKMTFKTYTVIGSS